METKTFQDAVPSKYEEFFLFDIADELDMTTPEARELVINFMLLGAKRARVSFASFRKSFWEGVERKPSDIKELLHNAAEHRKELAEAVSALRAERGFEQLKRSIQSMRDLLDTLEQIS